MKNLLIKIIISISIISFWNILYSNTYAEGEIIEVVVSEKIPGAECEPKNPGAGYKWTYTCKVKPWFETTLSLLWNIIKYFTYIAALWWVLFLIFNWILYSMWGADQSLKDDSKKRIIWTLIWLVLLLLSAPILNIIAPWIYK